MSEENKKTAYRPLYGSISSDSSFVVHWLDLVGKCLNLIAFGLENLLEFKIFGKVYLNFSIQKR